MVNMKKIVPVGLGVLGSVACFAEETTGFDVSAKITELTGNAVTYATSIGIAALTVLGIFFGVRFIKSKINLAK